VAPWVTTRPPVTRECGCAMCQRALLLLPHLCHLPNLHHRAVATRPSPGCEPTTFRSGACAMRPPPTTHTEAAIVLITRCLLEAACAERTTSVCGRWFRVCVSVITLRRCASNACTLSKPSPPPPAARATTCRSARPLPSRSLPAHHVGAYLPALRSATTRIVFKPNMGARPALVLRWVVAVMAIVVARADYHAGDFIPTARKGQFQGVRQARPTAPRPDAAVSTACFTTVECAGLSTPRRSHRAYSHTPPLSRMSTPQRVQGQGRCLGAVSCMHGPASFPPHPQPMRQRGEGEVDAAR
jgi:hypothetical protein